jgi:proliferating cell nuclear antigen
MKVFTEHINIMFESERMYIQALDNARISIFEVIFPSDWFQSYEHTENVTIGVNSNIMYKILSARDKTQQISLMYDAEKTDKLAIHFTSESKTEFDKHFEMSLMDIDNEIMDIPDMEYDAEFILGSSNFANIINQLKMFGDTLEIDCSEEKIMLCSSSVEQGKMFVEINIDDLSSFAITENEKLQIAYSLAQMHNICLYNKVSKEVEVKIKKDSPLKIIYHFQDNEAAKFIFYLAPKMNDNDD